MQNDITSTELNKILTEYSNSIEIATEKKIKNHGDYLEVWGLATTQVMKAIEAYVAQRVIEGRIYGLESAKSEYCDIKYGGPRDDEVTKRFDSVILSMHKQLANNMGGEE